MCQHWPHWASWAIPPPETTRIWSIWQAAEITYQASFTQCSTCYLYKRAEGVDGLKTELLSWPMKLRGSHSGCVLDGKLSLTSHCGWSTLRNHCDNLPWEEGGGMGRSAAKKPGWFVTPSAGNSEGMRPMQQQEWLHHEGKHSVN